ncbi:MAG: HAMP domain-containing histidine kinase [Clostridiales bacterium]|nr:HAMP domain-containing histidine kinase [Clostridiales bacterium]
MSGVKTAIFILIFFCLILLWKHLLLKRQIRNITKQITNLVSGNSQKMLDISLVDKDLERLAAILNKYNNKQRQTVAQAIRHEEYLKESIVNISHDLRTPLTVILGHLQLLQKSESKIEQKQRVLVILNKAEKMKSLISDFYEISVLDTKNVMPEKEKFNLSNLLLDLIAENAPSLEKRGILPKFHFPDYSVMLVSDRIMVERIFQNLITNAVRYSTGTINLSLTQKENGKIIFSIENPVSKDTKLNPDRLFERFYTGDKSRHNESTGIGLSVVKILVEKLDGAVSAKLHQERLIVTLEI